MTGLSFGRTSSIAAAIADAMIAEDKEAEK
jgi:hypothetical protein